MFTCPFASRGAGCFDGVFAPSIIHCPLLGGPTFPHRCRACFLVSCSGFTWIHICIVGQRKERNRLVRSLKKGQGWSFRPITVPLARSRRSSEGEARQRSLAKSGPGR